MIKVYVCGPYSSPDPAVVLDNVHRAMDAGDALEDLGFRAVIPHLSHFRHTRRPRGYEEWMDRCMDDLKDCHALLRLDGDSPGGDREIVAAQEWGIPVFFTIRQVEAWVNQ